MLSRHKVYSILYSSTLILPSIRRGERLLLLLTVEGENKKCYIITAYKGRYI